MRQHTLVIRADASIKIGTGHIMRCLALAQAAIKESIKVVFATTTSNKDLLDRIAYCGIVLHILKGTSGSNQDADEICKIISETGASWVVVDGYHFSKQYLSRLKQISGAKILVIDDYNNLRLYPVDILLNQNISATKFHYATTPECKLLLGCKYALLRDEFPKQRTPATVLKKRAENILVTMGGSDPNEVTLKVIKALELLNDNALQFKIIAGALNSKVDNLRNAVKDFDNNISIYDHINDMSAAIKWADIVISAAGSTCWEICCIGVPALVISVADNQIDLANELDIAKCADNLGWYSVVDSETIALKLSTLISDFEKRSLFSKNQKSLVDGKGASRTLKEMRYVIS